MYFQKSFVREPKPPPTKGISALVGSLDMVGSQTYGPFLGTLNDRGRLMIRIPKRTTIEKTHDVFIL